MKLMVLGYGRHGKDSVSEMLCQKFGMTFESSSKFVAEEAVRPAMAEKGITYPDFETMYADRVNHRATWKEAILAYNTPDRARLGRKLFAIHDIYCGLREATELEALKAAGIVDFIIWVDASKRLPPEDISSCTVTPDMADYILDNNGPEEDLPAQVERAYSYALANQWAKAS